VQIVHEHTAQHRGASAHREGGIRFLSLLQGEEDTPGNFHLMLVYANDFVAPRHRHNFDQIRIVMQGAFGFERGQVQEAGMLGYFTEGTFYTQKAEGPSTTLLLQAGGASGAGYMSDRQLRTSVDELQDRGSFHHGVFTWQDASGQKHNQDGYEAAWEHVRGRKISYPKPLFEQPVIWRGERFAWDATAQPGVHIRRFAEFTGKRLSVAQVRVDAGARCTFSAAERETLLYCISGQACLDGEALGPVSAVRLRHTEVATVETSDTTEFYLFGLMH
jgi:quercetin dioxygenase-like cupin family protein